VFTLIYPIWLLGISIFALVATYLQSTPKFNAKIMSYWGRGACWMFGVTVRVEGLKNIPEGPCVYLFNHSSFFDIYAMLSVMPQVYFGAKQELFNIPIFGKAGARFGMIPIPRGNRTEAIRNLQGAQDRFALGHQFALAPEGQRMPTEKLGPFKSGPFILAIEGQVPVVPVIIQNAAAIQPKGNLFPNWSTWRSEIVMHIETAIPTTGMRVEFDREILKTLVRQKMNQYIPNIDEISH